MNTEKRLYQWDTGQKLVGCTGLYVDFPIGDEVYRVETADGMCIIPDELLQTSGSHKVYECMTNNTIRSFAFSVTPRPQPPDYVFTPTERLTFEGLVQKVDDAVADMIRRAESGEFDGHTPVKGTDYFTTAEIQQIQNEVSSGAIGDFKSVVDTETETFNTNAETKLNAYNQNDSQKTTAYNTNAESKLNAYNANATQKLNAYNTNANNRVAEFDAHTEQIQTDISELKNDLDNLTSIIDFSEYDGYFGADGSISPPSTQVEKYTEKIPVKNGDVVKFRLKYDEVLNMWVSYCLYDSNCNIIGSRMVLISNNSEQYVKEIAIDTAKYISFSYRTYGKYKPNIWVIKNIPSMNNEIETNFASFKTLDLVEYDGYIHTDGSIIQSYGNGEKYTEKVNTELIKSLKLGLEYSQKRSMWIVCGLYKSDGTFIRNNIYNGKLIESYYTDIIIDDDVDYIIFSYRSFGEAKLQVEAEFSSFALSIINTWDKSKNNELKINSIKNILDSCITPFKFKPCYDHLFVNRGLISSIPHESLYHIRLSRKMGFNIIEANVYPTSDGVFIVNHLNNGTFGNWFHHVDEVTDISAINVNNVTWDWIVENVRYNSSIPKYRTRPCRLEEFLSECRQQNIIPFITSTDIRVIEMVDKYMGKDNYIAYGGSRTNCPNSIIYHWVTKTTKEEILAYCETIGRPFIYGMANPTAFTDDELKDIVGTLHKNGYWIGTSYADSNWHKYSAMGFDMNGTQGRINRIESGNIANLDSIYGFNDFIVTNAEEVNGILTFNSDGIITPNIDDSNYNVCAVDVEIDFNGSITIPMVGEHNSATTYTNDGAIPFFVAIPIINGSPKFAIQVTSGTTISDIAFKASKI